MRSRRSATDRPRGPRSPRARMLRRRGVKRVPCSSGFSWNSSQISDDGVDLTGLEVVLERRHALAAVDDENAHDLVVPASRGLVQRRPVGLDAHRRLQVADAARLREDLAAEPLRFVEIALLRLNGGCGRGELVAGGARLQRVMSGLESRGRKSKAAARVRDDADADRRAVLLGADDNAFHRRFFGRADLAGQHRALRIRDRHENSEISSRYGAANNGIHLSLPPRLELCQLLSARFLQPPTGILIKESGAGMFASVTARRDSARWRCAPGRSAPA